jgi:hypothetical protein
VRAENEGNDERSSSKSVKKSWSRSKFHLRRSLDLDGLKFGWRNC